MNLVLRRKQIAIDMEKLVKIIVGICIVILISNLVRIPSIGKSYAYQTPNKEFIYHCVPSKGNNEEDMIRTFEKFKIDNPEFQDLTLYRTFEKKWWKFWKWREYLTVERWKYPFLK